MGCGSAPGDLPRSGTDSGDASSRGSDETWNSSGPGTDGGTGGLDGPPSGDGSGGTAGAAGSGGTAGPDEGLDCTLVWKSGFEEGFPGEWFSYDTGAYSPSGAMPPGRVSAWTIVDDGGGEPVYDGEHSYVGWISGDSDANHRAYPVLHTDLPTPLINSFMVYLDANYSEMSVTEWIALGTWGNADDHGGGEWALHTMSVRDRMLEFAHTTPHSGEYIGPLPKPDFPVGRWVRLTVYVHYQGTDGFVQVWQDGVPMLRAQVSALTRAPGTKLSRAHWGMYASPTLRQGTLYNDEIQIWTLDTPLADLAAEPDCYLGR